MRIIFALAIIMAIPIHSFAQLDDLSIDRQTYEQYLRGDFRSLKKTSAEAFSKGIDHYYLRIRIGILSYNNQRYHSSVKHFNKALEFNAWDTISREYIYYSYLFAGRKADANLFLGSIPDEKKSNTLKQLKNSGFSQAFSSFSYSSFNPTQYTTNSLYYEAIESSTSANAGFESFLSKHLKVNLSYTLFSKTGTVYSYNNSNGKNLDFYQNQLYLQLTALIYPGWEFTGFGQYAAYTDLFSTSQGSGRRSSSKLISEYVGGFGFAKNGWRVRGGVNVSFSNFSKSNQFRTEGHLFYLPFGNLNLYLTSGGMFQNDKNWGNTFQINQEVGLKIFKHLWIESGAIFGNSFLYARNYGVSMNNSFLIPSTTIYSNFIVLLTKRTFLTLSPYYVENHIYSWDTINFTKSNRVITDSFGCNIKLTIKSK